MTFILALDQGTTSSRALLFDDSGQVRGVAQAELPQIYPRPGWVEHDPEQIWSTTAGVAEAVLREASISKKDVLAIGLTNQRETTVLWDRRTGRALANAIVWQDRRTAEYCSEFREAGLESVVSEKTGLLLDPYFSASKARWLLENVPGARDLAADGHLAFGTVDSWLLWKLSGGSIHRTDATNASRTMLYNISSGTWDDELLEIFSVPRSALPEVQRSSGFFAEVSSIPSLSGIPIFGVAGDQQAALFGQLCIKPGMAKNTYGTGCFALQLVGPKKITSKHRLLTTLACSEQECEYALEGSVFVGGAVVQWLRDGLGIVKSAAEIEALARTVPDSGGTFLVPAFVGLGAPHWDPYARGTLFGITRGTTGAHIARASLESIAYQVADLMDAMRADSGEALPELRVDGGAARNDLLLQFQADLLRVPVTRAKMTETTAFGAALLAGFGSGAWPRGSGATVLAAPERRFEPQLAESEARRLRDRWQEAVSRTLRWEQPPS